MARYASMMGKRVEVHYRAGDITLPATARLVADSGRSIFLEDHYALRGRQQTFRWEIPYSCILRLEESLKPSDSSKAYDPEVIARVLSPADLRMMSFGDTPEQA
jgi:hypothetical protein